MKRLLFILGLSLVLLPVCNAKKVVVLEVSREGKGWQNFFNCYERVVTDFVSIENGVTYANLRCEGAGYNFCRVSRQIGEIESTLTETQELLSNDQVIRIINDLIEQSEQAFYGGKSKGNSSKKIGIIRNNKADLYFINASWQYSDRKSSSPGNGKLIITIQSDDNSLLNRRND